MNTLGNKLRVTVFGQSHAPAIGCVIEGLPAGFAPDMERVAAFMARRAPGQNAWSTRRKEADQPEILSGLVGGRTCGAPLAMRICNSDQHSRDYSGLRRTPRPSHADYTALVKYGDSYDIRGAGSFPGGSPRRCASPERWLYRCWSSGGLPSPPISPRSETFLTRGRISRR